MKADDRERKRAWKAQQKAAARAAFPLPDAAMQEMFDYIEEKLASAGCDHSRRFTQSWLDEQHADAVAVLGWLDDTGGFCDCEVMANSQGDWERNQRE